VHDDRERLAQRDLDDDAARAVAGDRQQRRPRLVTGAGAPERAGAQRGQGRDLGERLGVRQHGRPAEHAGLRLRLPGRDRQVLAALDELHDGLPLAADEAAVRDVHLQPHARAVRLPLRDRAAHRLLHRRPVRRHDHAHGAGLEGARDDVRAVQHEVRRRRHERRVLRARRLALGGVDDDLAPAAGLQRGGELARKREHGAAATEQPDLAEVGDERRRGHQRRRLPAGPVLLEAGLGCDARQQARSLEDGDRRREAGGGHDVAAHHAPRPAMLVTIRSADRQVNAPARRGPCAMYGSSATFAPQGTSVRVAS
jgi:hypothetical protein